MHILLSKELLMSKKKTENNNSYDKKLAFKNNASFISCISKINNAFIGVAENLDVAMSKYNLFESSKNYKKTTGSL